MSHNAAIKNVSEDLIPLLPVDDLRPGIIAGVNALGVDLVLVDCQGQLRAYSGRCPHMGTLLSEGELDQGHIVCRAHQWRFDCASGEKTDDRSVCLTNLPVQIDGGWVKVAADQLSGLVRQHTELAEKTAQVLPGPRAWPVVGSLLSIDRRAFHRTLEAWAERYGPLYQCRLGRVSMTVVSDANIANAILKARPDTFRRTSQLEVVSISGMNTHGVFMAEGARWRKQRPVIMESLDTRHLKQFFPLLVNVTERLRGRWSRNLGETVDIQSDLMRYTVDVTTSLAFGQDINTLETEGDIIQEHLDKIFPTIQRRLLTPFPYWRYFRLPADRQAEKSVHFIYQAIKKFIAEGQKVLAANPRLRDNPENLLQSLLVAVADENAGFSEKEVSDNMMTMLLAGEDTTANSLAWAVFFLVKHPDIQDKLRAEIDSVLADKPLSSWQQVRTMPYLDAVIHESMRLKPVAPLNVHEANSDFVSGALVLKKGDYVATLTRSMAMRESDFADAGNFMPERWLPGREDGQINQRAFMPFGSGPRLCPGRSLALLEMKLVLVMILQNFAINSRVDLRDVQEELSFTMNPRGLLIAFATPDRQVN